MIQLRVEHADGTGIATITDPFIVQQALASLADLVPGDRDERAYEMAALAVLAMEEQRRADDTPM